MAPQDGLAERAVAELLRALGEDLSRDGLRDTPTRVAKALREMTAGYSEDPRALLERRFDLTDGGAPMYNGMVILRDLPFSSLCEHHVLPFFGTAHIGYIPGKDGRVVGVSKLARLLNAFALRLQLQERLTAQVADTLMEGLSAEGVIVVVAASHLCMRLRGVKVPSSEMVTSEVRGVFRDDREARAEALSLIGRA